MMNTRASLRGVKRRQTAALQNEVRLEKAMGNYEIREMARKEIYQETEKDPAGHSPMLQKAKTGKLKTKG